MNLTFLTLISVILAGLLALTFVSVHVAQKISQLDNQNQISATEGYAAAASISKGAILLLLAVGVIGFLGVSRKKKVSGALPKSRD